jgi:sec-independent protein translocase protein TatA
VTGLFTPWHIVLILFLALLLFGAKRLPEIGRSLGSSMREFKDAIVGKDDEPHQAPAQLPPPQPDSTTAATAPREHDTV